MDNSKELTHISLCAGYGGIDLGLKRALGNVRTVAFVEIEAFACANLVAKMEAGKLDAAPVWTDLKTFPWEQFREKVDILSGGFPCQPFSCSGIQRGDEDPRHLWPYIREGIRSIKPAIVFLENVEGILNAKLKGDHWSDPAGTPVALHVLRDLERMGYRGEAGVFSAEEVGAPHQRKRVFFMAVSESGGRILPKAFDKYKNIIGGRLGRGGGSVSIERAKSSVGIKSSSDRWPAPRGKAQFEWEPPRAVRR